MQRTSCVGGWNTYRDLNPELLSYDQLLYHIELYVYAGTVRVRCTGTPGWTRTSTGRCLKPLPLPIGLQGHIVLGDDTNSFSSLHWYPWLDSNQHHTVFEAAASADWATGALEREPGFEPG